MGSQQEDTCFWINEITIVLIDHGFQSMTREDKIFSYAVVGATIPAINIEKCDDFGWLKLW